MQRLAYLRTGTLRLNRIVDLCHPSICSKTTASSNNKNENDLGINTGIYKPSTTAEETHVPDELKGGQPLETISTPTKSIPILTGGGKVWSVQNPGSVHIAPLGATKTVVVPTSIDGSQTVHTTSTDSNISGTSTAHTTQPEVTPVQLAEAAAASAFETFAPDTPLTATPISETVFAPKISSTDVYSSVSSPTAQFGSTTSPTDTLQSKSFDSQNAFTSTKKYSNDPFDTKTTTTKSSDIHEVPVERESDIRDDILREALKHVQEKGWTMDAIRAGVRASNQPSTMEGLFSNGYDLVEYFMRDANTKMSAYMNEKAKSGEMQGSRLLVDGLKYRIGLVIPYASTWDQALAQGALPQNAMRGWKNLLDLSSDAWHGIGDTSTDINWYTKRLLLAAVYKSSEIYMLQDQSPEKIDTMNFLERRLSDFQTFGSVRNTVSKSLSDTAQIASGLFSVVRNLTSRR